MEIVLCIVVIVLGLALIAASYTAGNLYNQLKVEKKSHVELMMRGVAADQLNLFVL